MDRKKLLRDEKVKAEQEIRHLENRQKILLNRIRLEERRIRAHRLIEHGAILESIFPTVISVDGEATKALLIAISQLPEVQELVEKASQKGGTG